MPESKGVSNDDKEVESSSVVVSELKLMQKSLRHIKANVCAKMDLLDSEQCELTSDVRMFTVHIEVVDRDPVKMREL